MQLVFHNLQEHYVQLSRFYLRHKLRSLIIKQIILGVVVGIIISVSIMNDPKMGVSPVAVGATVVLAFVFFFALFLPVKYYVTIPLFIALRVRMGRLTFENKVINYDGRGLWFDKSGKSYHYEWGSILNVFTDRNLVYLQLGNRIFLIIPVEVVQAHPEFQNFLGSIHSGTNG